MQINYNYIFEDVEKEDYWLNPPIYLVKERMKMGRKAMLLSNCPRGKILKLLCYITLEVIGWGLVLYQNFPKPYFGYSLTNTQVTE